MGSGEGFPSTYILCTFLCMIISERGVGELLYLKGSEKRTVNIEKNTMLA